MRKIELTNGDLVLRDEVLGFMERVVTPFGCSGKVDCPKKYIGKRVYLLVCKD